MASPKRRPARQSTPSINPLHRLVLLPALHPDADPRPALLPPNPRPIPILFPSVAAALAELRRLQATPSRGGRA